MPRPSPLYALVAYHDGIKEELETGALLTLRAKQKFYEKQHPTYSIYLEPKFLEKIHKSKS